MAAKKTAVQRVKRPTSVRIVGHVWSIAWVGPDVIKERMTEYQREPLDDDTEVHDVQDGIVGLTCGQVVEILMGDFIAPSLAKERLLHEIMHACMYSVEPAGASFDGYEEYVLSCLDGPLWATLKENPEVLAWIVSE
jgi:hypothetical protein